MTGEELCFGFATNQFTVGLRLSFDLLSYRPKKSREHPQFFIAKIYNFTVYARQSCRRHLKFTKQPAGTFFAI
jgi:hypothetical protein